MNELHLQDKFLVPFLVGDLSYREVKANTVSSSLIIDEDLHAFVSDTELNRKPYENLLAKYKGDSKRLLADLITLIQERLAASRNAALFINHNKTVTLEGVSLHLFHPSGSQIHGDKLFRENRFSVVQELPYKYVYQGKTLFSFRPDLCFFVNGIYLGYSELKSNYNSQTARKNGRGKVIKDYFDAVRVYQETFDANTMLSEKEKEAHRKDFLKIFERAIHITATDLNETYVLRTIADSFDDILATCREGKFDREEYEKKVTLVFKPYPLLKPDADKKDKLKEIFAAHYSKADIEKEILYYNFIERDVQYTGRRKEVKGEGQLVAPRPKQKFGTDKILAKIDEFLAHEHEDDYFEKLLEKQLRGVSEAKRAELLTKRRKYANNRHVYSLLLQYAAGFGKSNIIGWTALQLKDVMRNGVYVYDKIMIVVDRLQLRGQLDSKMLNMNIDNKMYIEAYNKTTFQEALKSDTRLVIVNLQKFGAAKEMLDAETIAKLSKLRTVFLIDEIHRSNSGDQHEEMISIFDELQTPFDENAEKLKGTKKKNLIIGFTATPSDHTLARFGEFSGYAESEKLWVPFDSYTMKEAIEDGFILNPLKNIVPVATKMLFDLPKNKLEGFENEKEFKDAQKRQIYENRDRIKAISKYVADLLVKDVYRQIRGTGKAMLACYSIKAAIAYKEYVTAEFKKLIKDPKFEKYKDAPIHIVYSGGQSEQNASGLNDGLTEEKVLQSFELAKNGLIIVVAKLQTGFDEKKLHTLFLDKEVTGISAIQTISRVNRTTKYKNDCKIVDFSYNNVNVQNIKDAFEHFSDVVVSDWDPFADDRVLDILYKDLRKSEVFEKYYERFVEIHSDPAKADDPESYLNFESSLEKFIDAHPKRCADAKAKAAQYFTILNRIEFVITLDAKFSEPAFLQFLRRYNTIYNMMHRSSDVKDPIEVYFDNQIGIIEAQTEEPKKKTKKAVKVATGREPGKPHAFDILRIIEARNEQQAAVAELIKDFESKIREFFKFILGSKDGERLVVKINSHVAETEIYDDFSKLYRRYRALHRKTVGEYFFKETEDLVEKLCDDFEIEVRTMSRQRVAKERLKAVSARLMDEFSATYKKLAE